MTTARTATATTAEQLEMLENIFGPVISSYSRAQAIEDGELVDVSHADGCKGVFKFPVAMTRGAWAECIEAGGTWAIPAGADEQDAEELQLPGGQSVAGRLHDVCWMLLCAIRRLSKPTDLVPFSILVDEKGNGKHKRVDLYSQCGPGDNGEPVITILLQGED